MHASRGVYEETDQECEYSFFVSVRLMARQIIGESIKISVPEYKDSAERFFSDIEESLVENFVVTQQQDIEIQLIELEKEIYGVLVDIRGYVEDYPFVIYLTHPGRQTPPEIESFSDDSYGIIELSLARTRSLFLRRNESSETYLDRLRSFLEEDLEGKRWVAHPRYGRALERAEQRLESSRRQLLTLPSNERISRISESSGAKLKSAWSLPSYPTRRKVKYQCETCNSKWIGVEGGLSACPRCRTHLHRRILEDD